jgi:hypothetical protein
MNQRLEHLKKQLFSSKLMQKTESILAFQYYLLTNASLAQKWSHYSLIVYKYLIVVMVLMFLVLEFITLQNSILADKPYDCACMHTRNSIKYITP